MPVQRTTSENQHMRTATLKSGEVLHQSRYFLVRQKDRDGVLDQGVNETMTHEANVPSSNPAEEEIHYPLTTEDRGAYKTRAGKRLTPHQWAVYDFTLTIPKGKVTTYKDVAQAAGGSARSVGSALRNNPFPPYVPCHRVIASSLFVGGFFGEWGKDHKTGTQYNQKLNILAREGVQFNDKGHLLSSDKSLWKP